MKSETISMYCNYCGGKFISSDSTFRFCSDRCSTLFRSKFKKQEHNEFLLSDELLKLQLKIQSSAKPTNTLSKEDIMAFYDGVFNQIKSILKGLNAQALEKEHKSEDYTSLERKLSSVLAKAAEFRIENKKLKQKIHLLKNQDSKLATTLLGVDLSADLSVHKKAFNEKVKQFHPDHYSENDDIFKAIKLAFEIVKLQKNGKD